MDADLEARLRLTIDKAEIYDVLMRYCRGIDRLDRELIASCFHPDGIDDHGTPVNGPEFAARATAGPPMQKMSMHFVGNVLTEVEGDVANVESYCIAHLTLEPTAGVLDVGGKKYDPPQAARQYDRALGLRYVDRFERRKGQWKIAHRIVVDDWHKVDPVPDPAPPLTHGLHGSRSSSDPVYTFPKGELTRPQH